jgi:putative oxidoreductase
LGLGLAFASHGAQKLFGWFGGKGIVAAGGMFDGLGFRPGRVVATVFMQTADATIRVVFLQLHSP